MPKYFINVGFADKDEAKKIDSRCWWDPNAKSWWTNSETSPLIQKYGIKQLKKGPIQPSAFNTTKPTKAYPVNASGLPTFGKCFLSEDEVNHMNH